MLQESMNRSHVKKEAAPWCWKILKRRLGPDAKLFQEGDLYCKLSAKYIPLDVLKDLQPNRCDQFTCGLANCSQKFDGLSKYESHYNTCHRNVCQTCHRILPSSFLLDLHILETHDAMFKLMAEKQDMYQCLLESCGSKFCSTAARRDHMVKVHKYPSNYRFDRSKHNRTPKNKEASNTAETMEIEHKTEQNTAANKRIFSYKVPKSISFGQGVSRGFVSRGRGRGKQHKKHWHNASSENIDSAVDIEQMDMSDLANALS